MRPGPKVPPFDMDTVLTRLRGGESGPSIAQDIGVNVRTLTRRAKQEGRWSEWTAAATNHIDLQPCGTYASYRRGCRCRGCRAAWAARFNRWREGAAVRTPPNSVHGSVGGYCNWSCRCVLCVEAMRVANKAAYERRTA